MLAPRWPHSASKVRGHIIEALLLAVKRGTCDISVSVIPDSLGTTRFDAVPDVEEWFVFSVWTDRRPEWITTYTVKLCPRPELDCLEGRSYQSQAWGRCGRRCWRPAAAAT